MNTKLTLQQAAAAVGKSRPSLMRRIASGEMSAEKDQNGIWHVDASELFRVYPPVQVQTGDEQVSSDVSAADLQALYERVQRAEREAEQAKEEARRWQEQSAAWQKMAERLALTAAPQEGQKQAVETRRGWWQRLVGR